MTPSVDTVTISFPDLSPAEASLAAQDLISALAADGVPSADLSRARSNVDAQDVGSIVLVAAGGYLLDLLKEAGKEFVKGAANKAGSHAMEYVLRKWGTRAEVRKPNGECFVIGERLRDQTSRSLAQAQTLADLKSVAVVILGASQFPNYPASRGLDNRSFKRSAQIAMEIFSPTHTVFDIVDRIEEHVTKHPDVRDVVLYYCGHGDYLSDGSESFYLTLKGTRPGREPTTALVLRSFRQMISQHMHLLERRCYFVLDCCFAGAAVKDFQFQGHDGAMSAQIRDVLPSRGWAFLTAADASTRAIGQDGDGATMFTGALADVIEGRAASSKSRMSLSDLCEETALRIRSKHGFSEAVRPQCHAPRQPDGDTSKIELFLAPTHRNTFHKSATELPTVLHEEVGVSESKPAMVRTHAPIGEANRLAFSARDERISKIYDDIDRAMAAVSSFWGGGWSKDKFALNVISKLNQNELAKVDKSEISNIVGYILSRSDHQKHPHVTHLMPRLQAYLLSFLIWCAAVTLAVFVAGTIGAIAKDSILAAIFVTGVMFSLGVWSAWRHSTTWPAFTINMLMLHGGLCGGAGGLLGLLGIGEMNAGLPIVCALIASVVFAIMPTLD
jgi:Caspase domain